MKKLLTANKHKKHKKINKSEIISTVIICLTVCVLFIATSLPNENNLTTAVSNFAYYKADTNEQIACLMFNVYDNENNVNAIIEILRKYAIKATFFIGGIWAEKNNETLLNICISGNELGCHGYLHRDHSKLTLEQNKEEIYLCSKLIKTITGTQINLFAPPSGAYNSVTEEACKALGKSMIMWTKDTIDWRDHDTNLIVKRATKNANPGDFILMHPTDCTVQALPQIIEYYQNNGFDLVTVSEAINKK